MAMSRFKRGVSLRGSRSNVIAASCAAKNAPFSQAASARTSCAFEHFFFIPELYGRAAEAG
ncbi:MAG TPA: hypothetical protein VGC27_05665 [Rhizomicrobium sp.]